MSSPAPPSPNGDENRQGGILITTFVVTVLASIAVALRMATRIWIVKNVGWDDYTILFATIGIIIGTGLVVVQVHYGFGRHRIYLSENDFLQFTKYAYIEWIQTFQTLMFNKLSICFLLLRIPVEKYLIRPIQGAIVFLVVTNIILTLLWILQCDPVEGAWAKETSPPPKCFTDAQLQRIIISQALISIISDFALALFPIVLLWKVQIPIRVKVGLCTLMSLGLITAACCIVRTIGNWQNVNSDPTWASVNNWYWRSWEVSIGIIAACLPPLRPGYKALTSGINSYLSHRSSHRSNSPTLVGTEKSSSKPGSALAKIFHGRRGSHESGMEAAAHAVDVEANRAQVHGAGDDDFAMRNLHGDKKTTDQGIQKTTTIDIEDQSTSGSRRGLSRDECGQRTKDFV
ncbi:MAG: hypothetical protein Q9169_005968 [Polycauliona sp. 2 TL-2023]